MEVWVDHSDIRAGDRLPEKINDALKWCDTLLLIWSQAASKSRWVALEWQNALTLNKHLIPCTLDSAELPELLSNIVYHKIENTDTGLVQLIKVLTVDSSQHSGEQSGNYKLPKLPSIEFDEEKECKKLVESVENLLDSRKEALKKIGVELKKSISSQDYLQYRFEYEGKPVYFLFFWSELEYGRHMVGFYDGWNEPMDFRGNQYTAMIYLKSDVNLEEPVIEIQNMSLLSTLRATTDQIDKDALLEGIWEKAITTIEQIIPQLR